MENIGYEKLVGEYGQEDTDGVVDLIVDTLTTTQPTVRIGREDIPAEAVRSRFLKLDDSHIEYVFDCLNQTTGKVRNIRAYLLTSLYNAPTTIGRYYQTQVQHVLNAQKILLRRFCPRKSTSVLSTAATIPCSLILCRAAS